MKIHEFAEKHGLAKRQVDYYTAKKLLNPEVMENGYRDYNARCEEEVKSIILAKAMGYKVDRENIDAVQALLKLDYGRRFIQSQIEFHYDNVLKEYNRAKKVIEEWEV